MKMPDLSRSMQLDADDLPDFSKMLDLSALDLVIEEDTQIGNGVVTVYGSKCCMIHEAEAVLAKERRQSCGKCTFCREG